MQICKECGERHNFMNCPRQSALSQQVTRARRHRIGGAFTDGVVLPQISK